MGALMDFNMHFLPSFIFWYQFEQFQALSFPLSPFYEFIQILPIHLLLQPPALGHGICRAYQRTGLYIIGTSVIKEFIIFFQMFTL